MQWDSNAEKELWADICVKDFWWFLREAWGIDRAKAPSFTPRVHEPICRWLETKGKEWLAGRTSTTPRQKFIALLVPREFWKTSLVDAFLLWLHLQDTELSAYIGSETIDQAAKWYAPIAAIMSGKDVPHSHFSWLYGVWESTSRSWSSYECKHAARRDMSRKEPSFCIWGVVTGVTGTHPDILDLDDPTSYDRLEKDSGWFDTVNSHVSGLVFVLKSNGLMILPGTRYGDGDHFGRLFKDWGVREVSGMPLPEHERDALRPDGLIEVFYMQARDATGQPVYPEQWPEWRMKASEQNDPLKYAAQVMNDPSTSEFNPLTIEQANNCWVESEHVPFAAMRYTFHIDTALWYQDRQARGDDTVIVCAGHMPLSGDVYFTEAYGSNSWRSEHLGKKLVLLVQKYRKLGRRVIMITDEVAQGGKHAAWEDLLRNYFSDANEVMPPIKFLQRSGTKKEKRMREAAGYWAHAHVKLVKGGPGLTTLVTQMCRIGAPGGYNDYADASADAFHPEVYVPMRRLGREDRAAGPPQFPGDEILKDGRLSDRAMRKLYDASVEDEPLYDTI